MGKCWRVTRTKALSEIRNELESRMTRIRKHLRVLLAICILNLAGCGGSDNEVIMPENPEPLPPGGVQLQQLEDAESPPPIRVEP